MIVTEENEKYYLMAHRVDFLTEPWEREWYAKVLISAAKWGEKVDSQNKEYKKKHRLINRYNV